MTQPAPRSTPGPTGWWRALPLAALLVLAGCASTPGPAPLAPPSLLPLPAASTDGQSRLQQVFEHYQGTPYRYGGTDGGGFDCSGFIRTAYREALGQVLPRTTGQMLAAGAAVPPGQVRPGDVVFFRLQGKERHAGIYLGQGRFIHASTSVGVTASRLDQGYWRPRFSQVRRFR
ncbi:MAG: C40 family peptidase [Pseudomonadales bacterium]|nr:C40 family peptidase [Pseudomonadales bacterium]